ncbi:MAG: hypothetical protein QNK23_16365 [Crocinitomicaceae bacterium]|nr:hypothetical protein [Crocinitomicaceae bacterium]
MEHSKQPFLLTLIVSVCIMLGSTTFGQISSIQASFSTATSSYDDQMQITEVDITADIDNEADFGSVHVIIYSMEGDQVAGFKKSKSELITDGQLINGTLSITISDLMPSDEYKVEFQVKRIDGANYPVIVNTYNI